MKISESQLRPWAWIGLGTFLAVLLIGSFVYARIGWPQPALLEGEATYLMQAESLAHDFDLAYTRDDFDRTHLGRRGEPPDLELASGSGGRAITYDRPFPYALWLAPFLRVWPEHGFVFANVVLLILASLAAAVALARVLGAAAPLWVALLLFASVTWRYVWLATGDLFLFACVVLALSLIVRSRADRESAEAAPHPRVSSKAWLVAGGLLAIPLATEPLYGVFVVAALFTVGKANAGGDRGALLLGTSLSLLVQVMVQWWWSGGLHLFATTRFRFTRETGFPLIDFPAAEWSSHLRRFQALYWDEAPRFSWGVDPLLWLWDGVYVFVGRHIGLVPYFLPLVVLLAWGSYRGYRRAFAIAAGVWLAAMIVLHPFNLYGGQGAIANRLFLPVYGVLWFVIARRPAWPWAGVTLALSALFLWPSWTSAWRHPISATGGYDYVTPVAEKVLPFETSQRWIPANQTVDHMGLRLRLLNEDVWAETRNERLMLDAGRRARLVVASPVRLPSLTLEFLSADAPSKIRVRGARVEETVLLAEGGISHRLRPDGARRHATWWTPDRQWFYFLDLELPRDGDDELLPLAFQLFGEVLFEAEPP